MILGYTFFGLKRFSPLQNISALCTCCDELCSQGCGGGDDGPGRLDGLPGRGSQLDPGGRGAPSLPSQSRTQVRLLSQVKEILTAH